MSSIKIASVMCVIQFVVLSEGLTLSGYTSKAIGKRDLSTEVSDLVSGGDYRQQAVDFASDLRSIQGTAQNFVGDIENIIGNAVPTLGNLLEVAANRWANFIQSILNLGGTINKATSDCILNDTPFSNITVGLGSDLYGCVAGEVKRVTDLGRKGSKILWNLNDLIRKTEFAISACIGDNLVTGLLCATEYLPDLALSTLSLLWNIITTGLDLLTLFPVIFVRSIGCVAGALARGVEQTGSVDITRISCLVNHLMGNRRSP